MTNFVNRIRSWLKGGVVTQVMPAATIQQNWNEADIPRYPPFMKGLPVIPVDKILQTQSELIHRIRQTVTVRDAEFNRYYLPAISRFCDYAHLLPASQSHHHRGTGGLFRHSLEVALYALQASERVLLDLGKTPSKRREMESRWQFAVFHGALCHDAGKPVTDLTVTSGDRTVIWKPIKESLYTWSSRCGVNAYFLDWREGRARQHTAMSNLVADRIIGTESLIWMEEGGLELVVWLMESLNSNPSDTNPLHSIIIRADQASVERDLKTIGASMAGYDLGVPVERLLIDIMRRLVKEGIWQVNEPGARVWKIAGESYVVWPAGGEDMVRVIRDEKIPGLARTADGILEMMLERKQIQTQDDGQSCYWYISPDVLKQKIPDIRLQSIRLNDDIQVSVQPLQQVEGDICETNNAAGNDQDHEIATEKDGCIERDESRDLRAKNPVISISGQPTVASGLAAAPEPAISNDLTPGISPDTAHISLDGKAGKILEQMQGLIVSGQSRWGQDMYLDENGCLLIHWPQVANDTGVPAKEILEAFSIQQWLVVDPVTPWKKVHAIQRDGKTVKVVRLESGISSVFSEMTAGFATRLKEAEQVFQDTQSPRIPQTSLDGSEETAGKDKKLGRPENRDEFPVLDELAGILNSLDNIVADKDGWRGLDRKLLTRKIRGAGFRCTVVFLNGLAKEAPDRFSMDSTMFRWRV